MTPGRHNFVCPQGATFTRTITYKADGDPVNLSGYTARMQVRYKHDAPDAVVSLTSGGGITINGSQGAITITITAAATAAVIPGNYVYDLEIVSGGGVVTRLIEGSFRVTPEVTR